MSRGKKEREAHRIAGLCLICDRPKAGAYVYCQYHHDLIDWHNRNRRGEHGPKPTAQDYDTHA